MSKETVLPPDGSADGPGLDPHQEVLSRLSGRQDDGESRPSGSTQRPKKTQSPRGPPTKGHVTQEEEEVEEEPVRTQPRPTASEPGQRDASRSHNGLRYHTVSTSTQSPGEERPQPAAAAAAAPAEHARVPHMCTCGANLAPSGDSGGQAPGGETTSEQPRRQPSTPVSQKMQRKLRSSLSVNSDSSGSQKPPLPEDCCVHCILACLFCEFLALCNMVAAQASCGVCTPDACCCCCGDEVGDDCNCPCDMDCGIMDACCESSDCLEICMECCGICFPT